MDATSITNYELARRLTERALRPSPVDWTARPGSSPLEKGDMVTGDFGDGEREYIVDEIAALEDDEPTVRYLLKPIPRSNKD